MMVLTDYLLPLQSVCPDAGVVRLLWPYLHRLRDARTERVRFHGENLSPKSPSVFCTVCLHCDPMSGVELPYFTATVIDAVCKYHSVLITPFLLAAISTSYHI